MCFSLYEHIDITASHTLLLHLPLELEATRVVMSTVSVTSNISNKFVH